MTWTELKLKPFGIAASWKIARPARLSPILDRLSWSNKKKKKKKPEIWVKRRGRSIVCKIAAMWTLILLHCSVDNKFGWRIERFDWTRNNRWAKEDLHIRMDLIDDFGDWVYWNTYKITRILILIYYCLEKFSNIDEINKTFNLKLLLI